MFNTSNEVSAPYCQEPAFEEQLSDIRKRKEKVKSDIEAFKGFEDYHEIKREIPMVLFGAMHARLVSLQANEDRVLKRIDKAAEK